MEAKDIIKRLHRQWLTVKNQRQHRCEACHNQEMAERLAACDMFKGTEDMEQLAHLFASPQGIEFCLAANFPNLATLRLFKPFNPDRYGIYIDAGTIELKNPRMAILIGRTNATIECNMCSSHTIVAMHGASATILASGWAVVRTEAGASTNIVCRTSDNAVIL